MNGMMRPMAANHPRLKLLKMRMQMARRLHRRLIQLLKSSVAEQKMLLRTGPRALRRKGPEKSFLS
jgi:hypothetical protein